MIFLLIGTYKRNLIHSRVNPVPKLEEEEECLVHVFTLKNNMWTINRLTFVFTSFKFVPVITTEYGFVCYIILIVSVDKTTKNG